MAPKYNRRRAAKKGGEEEANVEPETVEDSVRIAQMDDDLEAYSAQLALAARLRCAAEHDRSWTAVRQLATDGRQLQQLIRATVAERSSLAADTDEQLEADLAAAMDELPESLRERILMRYRVSVDRRTH